MSIEDVLSGARRWHIETCRAEELEPRLPDGCVDLILTDPPFHKVKDLAWDREHKTAGSFLDWIGERLAAWRRILAPNGSLYVFASPGMAWGVEGKVREHFAVLTNIRWVKNAGWHEKARPEDLRAPFPASETIIFAESGRAPLATAIGEALRHARVTAREAARRLGYVAADGKGTPLVELWLRARAEHGACEPSAEQFHRLMTLCGVKTPPDYDSLARPFSVSAEVPYTDVWTYPTVNTYPGKHPCEKPAAMALDIVRASSRPGGLTLDLFGGSFVFSAAAVALGRRAIACDMDPAWCEVGRERCRLAEETEQVITRARRAPKREASPESGPRVAQLDLFGNAA